VVLYVHPPLPYQRAVSWAGKDAVQAYYDEESDSALSEALKLLAARNVPYHVEKRIGDAAQEIIDVATKDGCDLIAMGTHGRTALANLVLGSVATKVLAGTKLPVLFLH
jgi:nucleotide-binding universal stress UspA family protein